MPTLDVEGEPMKGTLAIGNGVSDRMAAVIETNRSTTPVPEESRREMDLDV